MSTTRWHVEFRAVGETRYRESLPSHGFEDRATALMVAERAAAETPEMGVRVVEQVRTVVWSSGQR